MPPPHPEPTVAAGTRRNLDERSVRPSPPACALAPSGPLCPRSSARQGFSSHRRAVWVSPPPAPEAESTTPTTSDSRPVQIVLQILVELLQRPPVHTRRTPIG